MQKQARLQIQAETDPPAQEGVDPKRDPRGDGPGFEGGSRDGRGCLALGNTWGKLRRGSEAVSHCGPPRGKKPSATWRKARPPPEKKENGKKQQKKTPLPATAACGAQAGPGGLRGSKVSQGRGRDGTCLICCLACRCLRNVQANMNFYNGIKDKVSHQDEQNGENAITASLHC